VDENLRLVGGTFTFKGVTSPVQHHLLRKALRLAVYVHLSLLLEQALLSNSGVRLNFARPKLPAPSPSTPLHSTNDATQPKESISEPTSGKSRRSSIVPSSFTNFFLKRGFSYRRSNTINPPAGRNGGSLDLNALHPSTSADGATPRRSIEGAVSGLRLRRLSFLGDRRISLRKSTSQPIQVKKEQAPYHPFWSAAKRIEESRSCLSTSPGVSLSVPKLILELAEKEKRNDAQGGPLKRRLKGDERVALTSILGWDGKDAEGRGMSGILGFVRHQEISLLCSAHVPSGPSTKLQSSHPSPPSIATDNSTSSISAQSKDDPALERTGSTTALNTSSQMSASSTANLPQSGLTPCGKPHWTTYQYYSTQNGNDFALGEWLHDTAMRRTMPCEMPGCKFLQGQHERRLIHDGVRLVIRLFEASEREEKGKEKEKETEDNAATDSGDNPDAADILMWESCAVCDAKTPRTKMSDGTL
jgi:1-phosphatidylinositol-3-phosphate 5-kinase